MNSKVKVFRVREGFGIIGVICFQEHQTPEQALEAGRQLVGAGVCVLVCSGVFEQDGRGRFRREWRSVNGEGFQESLNRGLLG